MHPLSISSNNNNNNNNNNHNHNLVMHLMQLITLLRMAIPKRHQHFIREQEYMPWARLIQATALHNQFHLKFETIRLVNTRKDKHKNKLCNVRLSTIARLRKECSPGI